MYCFMLAPSRLVTDVLFSISASGQMPDMITRPTAHTNGKRAIALQTVFASPNLTVISGSVRVWSM